jgi:hypothetical protein
MAPLGPAESCNPKKAAYPSGSGLFNFDQVILGRVLGIDTTAFAYI